MATVNPTSNIIHSRSSTRAKWIPAKIGHGWDYVSLLVISAFFCISCVYWTASLLIAELDPPLIVASMGAAAVLMFASPASPMASSWAFIVGNLLSALVGTTVFLLLGNTPCSAGLAVAAAILVMHVTHSIHPPGGATALFAVIGGPAVENLGYLYTLTPVAINLIVFFLFVQLNRHYLRVKQQRLQSADRIHDAIFACKADSTQASEDEFVQSDIEQALTLIGGNPDISLHHLKQVLDNALRYAKIRKAQQNHYKTLQIRPPKLHFGDELLKAWRLLQDETVEVITVLYPGGKIAGVLTLQNFIALVEGDNDNQVVTAEYSAQLIIAIEAMVKPSGLLESHRPEVCGQLARSIEQQTSTEELNEAEDYVALVDDRGFYQCLLTRTL